MQTFTMLVGILCLLDRPAGCLSDHHPAAAGRRPSASHPHLLYLTWIPWRFVAPQDSPSPQARDRSQLLRAFIPDILLVVWAMWHGLRLLSHLLRARKPIQRCLAPSRIICLASMSAERVSSPWASVMSSLAENAARALITIEGGTGFGFLAIVMGTSPSSTEHFRARGQHLPLDARAGSPPTAAELMRRHTFDGAQNALATLLSEWERWSAELLESHISYTLLCYFRSQHTNQSWISALTAILDTSALLIAGVQGHEARQAQLTFAMARHALVDLAQVFSIKPRQNIADRLPRERYEQLYQLLCQSGVSVCRDGASYERLRDLRALYEGYAASLSDHLCMPLPPWMTEQPHKDNWLAVAKVREPGRSRESRDPHSIAEVIDRHHEF